MGRWTGRELSINQRQKMIPLMSDLVPRSFNDDDIDDVAVRYGLAYVSVVPSMEAAVMASLRALGIGRNAPVLVTGTRAAVTSSLLRIEANILPFVSPSTVGAAIPMSRRVAAAIVNHPTGSVLKLDAFVAELDGIGAPLLEIARVGLDFLPLGDIVLLEDMATGLIFAGTSSGELAASFL